MNLHSSLILLDRFSAEAFDESLLACDASPQSDSTMCVEQQLRAKLAQAAAKFAKQSHELATLRAANDSLKVANTRLVNRVHWSPKLLSGLKSNELKALKDGVHEEEVRAGMCLVFMSSSSSSFSTPCALVDILYVLPSPLQPIHALLSILALPFPHMFRCIRVCGRPYSRNGKQQS